MAAIAAPIISGLGSLVGGLFGLGGAKKASNADKQAAQIAQQAGAGAQNFTKQELAQSQDELSPYIGTGQNAFSTLGSLMQQGAGGQGPLASYTGSFKAPTAAEAEATPGYQFQLQQGELALQNSAAARGGLLSTGTGKSLEQYGQNLASTNYQQTFNNAMQAYQQQYAEFQNNQSNLYNRLLGVGQTGLNATQTSVGAALQGAGLYGQQGLNAASLQAGYTANAGGAQAVGLAGLGGSIGSAMNSFAGAIPPSQTPYSPNQGSWTTPGGGYGPNAPVGLPTG